jgi:hypothetical protein
VGETRTRDTRVGVYLDMNSNKGHRVGVYLDMNSNKGHRVGVYLDRNSNKGHRTGCVLGQKLDKGKPDGCVLMILRKLRRLKKEKTLLSDLCRFTDLNCMYVDL